MLYLFFFFKQKTAYEMRISDWSSDVCSSDLNRRVCLAILRFTALKFGEESYAAPQNGRKMFCENDIQTLGDESREVIFQVGRAYLERHGIPATQLVFDPAKHPVLLDAGPRFKAILQRLALLTGHNTKRPGARPAQE